jgi:hypothetical protein
LRQRGSAASSADPQIASGDPSRDLPADLAASAEIKIMSDDIGLEAARLAPRERVAK